MAFRRALLSASGHPAPTHLYSSDPGGYAVYNDGTHDWATEIYDQISGNHAVQSTQSYRTKIKDGAFLQDKAVGGRINYSFGSAISLDASKGYAIVLVRNSFGIVGPTGSFYFLFGSGGQSKSPIIYRSTGATGFGYTLEYGTGSYSIRDEIAISIITENKILEYSLSAGLTTTDLSGDYTYDLTDLIGRASNGGGSSIQFGWGKIYQVQIFKDMFLTDQELRSVTWESLNKYTQ